MSIPRRILKESTSLHDTHLIYLPRNVLDRLKATITQGDYLIAWLDLSIPRHKCLYSKVL